MTDSEESRDAFSLQFTIPLAKDILKNLVNDGKMEGGRKRLATNCLVPFLPGIQENCHEKIKLVKIHGWIYEKKQRVTTQYLRINAYCQTCIDAGYSEDKAKYLITITDNPFTEKNNEKLNTSTTFQNFITVRVKQTNKHNHQKKQKQPKDEVNEMDDEQSEEEVD